MRYFMVMLATVGLIVPVEVSAQSQSLAEQEAQIAAELGFEDYGDMSRKNLEMLIARMCSVMHLGRNTDSISVTDGLYDALLTYSGVEESDPHAKAKASAVFNRYSSFFVCSATGGLYPTQHLFKRAYELNIQQEVMIDFFMREFLEYPIDFNAVETDYDGTQTTLLDYINKQLALPNSDEIINIGEIIRHRRLLELRFGAKSVSEMTPEELEFQTTRAREVRESLNWTRSGV